jgi:hypothetical protein
LCDGKEGAEGENNENCRVPDAKMQETSKIVEGAGGI